MKRLPIPARFHEIAAHLGVGVRHYINDYAVRGNILSKHEQGHCDLTQEERKYIINLMMGRMERVRKRHKE